MPRSPIPTIPSTEVSSHGTEKSCYVLLDKCVYDVTSFLDDHPGGPDLILEYGGKDVTEIMRDESSHIHSETAYEILKENLVDVLASDAKVEGRIGGHDRYADIVPLRPNIMETVCGYSVDGKSSDRRKEIYSSGVEDLTKENDFKADFPTHRFLDLRRPLLGQVWSGNFTKDFYLEQVHQPRHYAGGGSAPLFGNALEPLSKTPWWIVPLIYVPPIIWGTYVADRGMRSPVRTAVYWLSGSLTWPFVEYIVHRAVCHMDRYLPDNRIAMTAHFLLHGLHHYLPMDPYRLASPPYQFMMLAIPFYRLVHSILFWDWYAATAVFCGWMFGYVYYEITHFGLHTRSLPASYKGLKKYHLQHHYADYENGFGVTTRFWDWVFGTELSPPKQASRKG